MLAVLSGSSAEWNTHKIGTRLLRRRRRVSEEAMIYNVIVQFGKGREYEFAFPDTELTGLSPDQARRWFDGEFQNLGCEPTNRMGKVLIIDKILHVARDGGEQRFSAGKEWAEQFARNAALALGRDTIRVDVADFAIGY